MAMGKKELHSQTMEPESCKLERFECVNSDF